MAVHFSREESRKYHPQENDREFHLEAVSEKTGEHNEGGEEVSMI